MIKGNDMKTFLENKFVGVYNIYLNPIIIGGIFSSLGSWDPDSVNDFFARVLVLIILLVWYAYTICKYKAFGKEKKNENDDLNEMLKSLKIANKKMSQEMRSYNKGIRELAALFYDSSKNLNEVSKNVLSGNRTLDIWNFKRVATGICSSVYSLLCDVCSPYDNFTVNIMLSDITATGKKRNITMIAHKGKYETYPGKFEEKLYFDKNNTFYAVKLFKDNKTDIKILTTKEEVNEKFVYVEEEHPEYSQYVGIPVVCSGNKIICLLQICAFGDHKIGETKEDVLKVVTEYIMAFSQYALLAYKAEKSLVSGFSIISKMEEEKTYGKKINQE